MARDEEPPFDLEDLLRRYGSSPPNSEVSAPPSFFNIMTHLLVDLVKEIDILGPVFLHNMFPFERFMGVLKKCVRNRARPEELRRSLTFVLTLLMTLNRLESLNRDMRGD